MDFALTPDQLELQERGRRAGAEWKPFAIQWDTEDTAPLGELTKRMGEHGLLGLTIPKEYGGQDRNVLDYVIAAEAVVRASLSGVPIEPMFRTSAAGPSMLLMADNEAARQKFMTAIVSGERGCALTLTEPDHGSDITFLETSAYRDGDEYVINGKKRFITGAGEDDLYATFVRFDTIPGSKGIGAIMVEKGTPGFEITVNTRYVGSRGVPHGELAFTDCRVPVENLIVREGSFARLMTAFNMERAHNASFALGLAAGAMDETMAYAQQRRQFGRPIAEFQSIYHQIADMWVKIEAARYLLYRAAASALDGKYPEPLTATAAKYFANDVLFHVASAAVEIHGGNGVTTDYHVQRILRDSLVSRIAGGTPSIAKNVIAAQIMPEMRFSQMGSSPVAASAR